MKSIYVEVKALPGSDIENACAEACRLSSEIHAQVAFNFNGVEIFVSPVSDWREAAKRYYEYAKTAAALARLEARAQSATVGV